MIALDTNVLVRFLVKDDVAQSERVSSLISQAIGSGSPLYVSDVVLCKTVWVLLGAYRFARGEISDVIEDLLRARHLLFSSTDHLATALRSFKAGSADFADYLICEYTIEAGCTSIATFDRALLKEPGFVSP